MVTVTHIGEFFQGLIGLIGSPGYIYAFEFSFSSLMEGESEGLGSFNGTGGASAHSDLSPRLNQNLERHSRTISMER